MTHKLADMFAKLLTVQVFTVVLGSTVACLMSTSDRSPSPVISLRSSLYA